MDAVQITVLALIQGITEFLPISSSGHLILPAQLLGWQDQGIAFDAAVHIGTLVAVMLYFRKDIWLLIRDWTLSLAGKGTTEYSRMAWYVGLATFPAVIFGLLLKMYGIDEAMRSTHVIIATTLIFGTLMGVADYFGKRTTEMSGMTLKSAMMIGFAQAIALIPGTSRSGITITAALMLGFKREVAARFSFLLSIPVTMGASLLVILDLVKSTEVVIWSELIAGALISGVSAMLCIHFFLGMISRAGLMPFVIYRLLLAVVLLIII
ncbi:UDP pyrophosphate phosphatase [Endozoicomonas montiporae]|uniref:Undecaprenyl-diphosphatase n=2 Tax=Endozoicomonas montiporae TaxID=1027273 RepID=A0A081NCB5_9GAMM|nr:undecaprenyl-diphosphate phosphatase [Endozoicomonas montiporae]AMO56420.1 undecaprenyl pyrophosphate phosphatase [Endozoicomonas montiporae CL-33]KEQ16088.1 UDP pyrophosphate phosphatase [Endozoicomonas montiporae]